MGNLLLIRARMVEDGSERDLIIEDGVIACPDGPLHRSPDPVGWVLPGDHARGFIMAY